MADPRRKISISGGDKEEEPSRNLPRKSEK